MHYTYILLLANKQLYAGETSDLKRRLREHTEGKVASTKNRRPLRLVFYEAFHAKEDALRREQYFKTSKGKSTLKLMLRASMIDLQNVLNRCEDIRDDNRWCRGGGIGRRTGLKILRPQGHESSILSRGTTCCDRGLPVTARSNVLLFAIDRMISDAMKKNFC